MSILELLVQLIHCIFVFAIILVPFSNNTPLLEMYVMFIPFLAFHWIVNDNTCALTLLECYITGNDRKKAFIGRVVEPIYDINDNYIYFITFILYCISMYKIGNPIHVYIKYYNNIMSKIF